MAYLLHKTHVHVTIYVPTLYHLYVTYRARITGKPAQLFLDTYLRMFVGMSTNPL